MKNARITFLLLTAFALLLTACGEATTEPAPAEPTAPAMTEAPAPTEAPMTEIALKVTGDVASERAWTENEVKAMDTIEAESKNSQGETSKYTGVLLADLLAAAQPNADANTVFFVGDGGATAEVSLAEVTACTNCIVSFRNKGGFSIVMPGFGNDLQVKGVIEIQVK